MFSVVIEAMHGARSGVVMVRLQVAVETARFAATIRNDTVPDLRDGSITTITEAADGSVWCGSRAGAIHCIDGAITRAAANLGAILASASSASHVAFSTARGQLVALDPDGRA